MREQHLWSTAGPLSAPFDKYPCPCRSEHAPSVPWTHGHHLWPLFAGGPDSPENLVYVCPATHDWAHVIWRVFEKNDGPVSRQRTWPFYAYNIAVEGWEMMTA